MLFLLLYVLQLLFFVLVFTFFDINDSEGVAVVFVIVNVFTIIYLFIIKLKPFVSINLLGIVLMGFLIRLIVLFLDVYNVVPILHSGADSEGFHEIATFNYINAGFNGLWLTYTNYSDILSYIYILCNAQRLVGQYLNIILGMGVIYYIWLSCRELKITKETTFFVIACICFFPTAIIFSGILLREAWQEFFLMYSFFYFTKWFRSGKNIYMIIAILSVVVAAYMHSGSLCIIIGYLFAYIFYIPHKDVIQNDFKNSIKFIFVIGVFLLFFFSGSTFTDRFDVYKEMEKDTFFEGLDTSRSNAGSVYLQWINITSTWQMILFSPIKMFYFMFSPIPLDWRGMNDVIAFLFDSTFYLFFIYKILKCYKLIRGIYRRMLKFIGFGFLVTVFVFSYGTSTAGTAMRHRCKVIGIILVSYAVARDERKDLILQFPV